MLNCSTIKKKLRISDVFNSDYSDIVSLNKVSLERICKYLGIDREIIVFSEMCLDIAPVTAPDEWALNICKAMGEVDEYWNPVGGLSFFDKSKYYNAGINLYFQEMVLTPYRQLGNEFESGMSIIDVMMFNSPESINEMLDNFKLL